MGEKAGQVPARPALRIPTLTVNVTGFPSLPVTRAGGPVSRAAIWIARRLVIPGTDDVLVAAVTARDVLRPHVLTAGLGQVGQHPVAHGVAVTSLICLKRSTSIISANSGWSSRCACANAPSATSMKWRRLYRPVIPSIEASCWYRTARRPLSRKAANWRRLTRTVSTTTPSSMPPTELNDQVQADDDKQQIAARDREEGQGAGPGGGLLSATQPGVLPTRSWHTAATHKMVSASIHKVSTGSPPW